MESARPETSPRELAAGRPRFGVRMKGDGLEPETVDVRELAAFLANLAATIVETARESGLGLDDEADAALVSLVGVDAGASGDYTFAVAEPIVPAVSAVASSVFERRTEDLPLSAQGSLYALSEQAAKQSWSFEFRSLGGWKLAPSVISPVVPVPEPAMSVLAEGASTLWGNVFKIGGDSPHVVLRLRDGSLFRADVTREIIEEIQALGLIYRDVGLSGVASWRPADWSLVSFLASEIAEYRPDDTSPARTFRDLRSASDGRWEGVDPVKYVDDLRSEGPSMARSRARRGICFDTGRLIWGVREDATRGQEPMIERTSRYIEHLSKLGIAIMVPAPVVAEYLVGATETEIQEATLLRRGFEIPAFDLRAAMLAAELQRGGVVNQIRDETGLSKPAIRIDAFIIAIAIANGAEEIVTHDTKGFRRLARGKIEIIEVPVIPEAQNASETGEVPQQRDLVILNDPVDDE